MKSIMGNHGTFFDPYQGGKGKATKPVLICGGIAAGLALVGLAICDWHTGQMQVSLLSTKNIRNLLAGEVPWDFFLSV